MNAKKTESFMTLNESGEISQSVHEQMSLFSYDRLLPDTLPRASDLKPALHLAGIFEACHNYIYANEGILKDKAFHEMVKILTMKLYDEKYHREDLLFGITSGEYGSLLSKGKSFFEKRMEVLFEETKSRAGAFLKGAQLNLKPLTLAYVVSQLQFVDLTNTPRDVKGEAFQAFVYRHQRGDRGEFFTPHPIVRLAVEMIAPSPTEKVIDPACGSGGFLIGTIGYIKEHFPKIDVSEYIREKIRGVEFNPDIALSASLRLVFEGGTGEEIIKANTLSEVDELDGKFDVVLTNPPFGSKGKVKDTSILQAYDLAHKWQRDSGGTWRRLKSLLPGQSPEILFIEKSLRLLKPGGRMAIVLPDGLLQNKTNAHIRFWIRERAEILGIVSIPQEAFIPYGTGIKTSLVVLQKKPVKSPLSSCFMARMEKVGYDVKGQPLYKRDREGKPNLGEDGLVVDDDVDEIVQSYGEFLKGTSISSQKVFLVAKDILNSRLDVEHYSPQDVNLIAKLRSFEAKPIKEIADIVTEKDDFRSIPSQEIRYIAISDVDARTMQVVSQQRMRAYEAPSRAKYRVFAGDIITAISGASTGTYKHATAIITKEEEGAICSNGFAVLRNIRIEPLYLLVYLRTEYFLRQVRRLMTGHAIPSLSLDDLANVLVFIPPRDVQQRISSQMAEILLSWREALKRSEELIGEVENFLK